MNYRIKNLIGLKFGRLVVRKFCGIYQKGHLAIWLCQCECGKQKKILSAYLLRGGTRSCGCLRNEMAKNLGKLAIKHGDYKLRLYKIWEHMKYRCNRPNCKSYKYYGKRGIFICDEWKDYEGFKRWALSSGYKDNLTIDRIDRNRGYYPDNCQWISRAENTRKTFIGSKRKGRGGPIIEYGQGILSLASKYREQGIT